jgi:probable rRNA maturation factor
MTDDPESMDDTIAVILHDAAWQDDCADLEARARAAVATTLRHLNIDHPLEVSLLLTDDAEQRVLNRQWRGKDKPTNVLSFPNMDDDTWQAAPGRPQLLGDVVLARETVTREAAEQGKPFAHHALHLVVHGTLHLLGYDHEGAAEAAEMEGLERAILARLGIADPYAGETPLAEAGHG